MITFKELSKKYNFNVFLYRKPQIDNRLGLGLGYRVIVERKGKSFETIYNNSIAEGKNTPKKLDIFYSIVLDVCSFANCLNYKDFCFSFGYEEGSKEAHSIYKACSNLYTQFTELFTDKELNELSELLMD